MSQINTSDAELYWLGKQVITDASVHLTCTL